MKNQNGHGKRAVLYARVSSDDRGRDGRNLAGQLEMCREYAERHGWQVVAELAEDDRGASGASYDLPQLNRALAMAGGGEYDILVTREIDRFARKLAKQLVMEQELQRRGVTVEYVLGEYADTPEGQLMKHVRAVIAEYEREKIKERTARARFQKVKAGSVMCHGNAPFGYRLVEQNGHWALEIVEEQAEIIRMIFDLYTGEDPMSIRAIARYLTDLHVPTPTDVREYAGGPQRRRKGKWSRATIGHYLSTETYAGVWYYGDNEEHQIAVEVPAIISRLTWERAQARRNRNKKLARRNTRYDYLLRGFLTCGRCGASMGGAAKQRNAKGDKTLYYRCNARHDPSNYIHNCDAPYFRADKVDAAAWLWIRRLLSNPDEFRKAYKVYLAEQEEEKGPLRERLNMVDRLLSENRQQMERLIDLYLTGDLPRDMLAERKDRLETTITALEKEHAELSRQIEAGMLSASQIDDLWKFAARVQRGLHEADDDFELQRYIVETMGLEGALVDEDGKKRLDIRCHFGQEVVNVSTSSRSCNRAGCGPRCAGGRSRSGRQSFRESPP